MPKRKCVCDTKDKTRGYIGKRKTKSNSQEKYPKGVKKNRVEVNSFPQGNETNQNSAASCGEETQWTRGAIARWSRGSFRPEAEAPWRRERTPDVGPP
jgi:hypothetical protein